MAGSWRAGQQAAVGDWVCGDPAVCRGGLLEFGEVSKGSNQEAPQQNDSKMLATNCSYPSSQARLRLLVSETNGAFRLISCPGYLILLAVRHGRYNACVTA